MIKFLSNTSTHYCNEEEKIDYDEIPQLVNKVSYLFADWNPEPQNVLDISNYVKRKSSQELASVINLNEGDGLTLNEEEFIDSLIYRLRLATDSANGNNFNFWDKRVLFVHLFLFFIFKLDLTISEAYLPLDFETRLKCLKLHKPRTKYWVWKIMTLLQLRYARKLSFRSISRQWRIPYWSVLKIWRRYYSNYGELGEFNKNTIWFHYFKDVVVEYVDYYWKHSKGWFVSNDIRIKIYHDLEIEISDKRITDILKNDLRKSYKKGPARPASLSSRRHSLTQKLYAAEFISLWKSNYLYINIDEVLFSNKTKFNYSWLNRGASGSLQNTIFKGSKSIIAAISSTGKWLISELNCKNNSDFFIKFLHKLERWVVFDLKMKLNDTIIIMDNSSIHKSWKTLDFIRKSNAIYSFFACLHPRVGSHRALFRHYQKKANYEHTRYNNKFKREKCDERAKRDTSICQRSGDTLLLEKDFF